MATTSGNRPESIIDMFSRLGHTLPIPNLDVDRIIDHHRKNLEALEEAARAGSDGAAAMFNRQRDMLQQMIAQATENARAFKMPSSPQEMMSGQVDMARRAFEQAVENTSELATMMQQSGSQSTDILRERIKTAMNELGQGFAKKP